MYTKREWRLRGKVIGFPHYNIMNDDVMGVIAHIPCHAKEFKANAQLIASAPDLYKACKITLSRIDDRHDSGDLAAFDYIRNIVEWALAKAESTTEQRRQ